jgi:hypothetical protein
MAASSKLLKALGFGGLAYGGFVGLNAQIAQPKNIDEARQNATVGSFATNVAKDIGISFADDALLLIGGPLLARRLPIWEGGLKRVVTAGVVAGGAGVAGAFAGRDFQQYIAAKQYVANYDRNMSGNGSLAATYSPNRISGFNNHGQVGSQRAMMTGINSPTSDSITYRMENNPFGSFLNSMVTSPSNDPNKVSDPRAKALSFSYLGGIAGGIVGGRMKGLAGGTIGGLVGASVMGAYGIYRSHNPSLGQNLAAFGDVAKNALPATIGAGLLFGATRIPKLGKALGKLVTFASSQVARGGRALEVGTLQLDVQQARLKNWRAVTTAGPADVLSGKKPNFFAQGMKVSGDLAYHSAVGSMGLVSNISHNVIAPTLMHTDPEGRSMWMQSLALGHVISFGPHQYLAATTAANLHNPNGQQPKKKRGKHASNTMPSNSPT